MIAVQSIAFHVVVVANCRRRHAIEILAKTDAHNPESVTPYRHCKILVPSSGVT
jgi:hypothetical protein